MYAKQHKSGSKSNVFCLKLASEMSNFCLTRGRRHSSNHSFLECPPPPPPGGCPVYSHCNGPYKPCCDPYGSQNASDLIVRQTIFSWQERVYLRFVDPNTKDRKTRIRGAPCRHTFCLLYATYRKVTRKLGQPYLSTIVTQWQEPGLLPRAWITQFALEVLC